MCWLLVSGYSALVPWKTFLNCLVGGCCWCLGGIVVVVVCPFRLSTPREVFVGEQFHDFTHRFSHLVEYCLQPVNRINSCCCCCCLCGVAGDFGLSLS